VSRVERNSRLGRAFEKAVRRKPLARRTRALWLTNQALRSVRIGRPGRLVKWRCYDNNAPRRTAQ